MQRTQEKRALSKNLVIAIIVVAFFLCVLVGQFVAIGILNAKQQEAALELAKAKALEDAYRLGLTGAELQAYLLKRALEEGWGDPNSPYFTEN